MHLPRHTIESHAAVPLFVNAAFSSPSPASSSSDGSSPQSSRSSQPGRQAGSAARDGGLPLSDPSLFACATSSGFIVAQCEPLKVVARRSWPAAQGGLSHAVPVQHSSLLVLVGGGRVPRFAPNKVILWDEMAEGRPSERSSTSRGKQRASEDDEESEAGRLSRRASTVFSAGSKFDSVILPSDRGDSGGSTHPASDEDWDRAASASPPDSLRFSRNSLVDMDDVEDLDLERMSLSPASSSSLEPRRALGEQAKDAGEADMGASFGASSVGIGRLHGDYEEERLAPRRTSSAESDQITNESYHAAMITSSASISASSAGLDDPFAMEEPRSRSPSPPRQSAADGGSRNAAPAGAVAATSGTTPLSQSSESLRATTPPPRSGVSSLSASAVSTSTSTTQAETAGGASTPKPRLKTPSKGREVAELEFGELVRGVCIASIGWSGAPGADASHTTVLTVLLASKAIIFELSRLSGDDTGADGWTIVKRAAVDTYKNVQGLGAVAPQSPSSAIVAVPGRQKGHVQIIQLRVGAGKAVAAADRRSSGASTIVVAHEASIAAMALSPCGRFLATASSKGTLIRIWSSVTRTGTSSRQSTSTAGRTGFGASLVRELRRGTDPARILSMGFAPDGSALAAASDKGTVHIFQLSDIVDAVRGSKGASSSSFATTSRTSSADGGRPANVLGGAASRYLPGGLGQLANHIPASMLPQYFKSEWSGAQFRVPLKTFGADSRAPTMCDLFTAPTSGADGGDTDSGTTHGTSQPLRSRGTEKSTDGAWAAMKGRLEDIRRGEPGVDERIFLCWVVLPRSSSEGSARRDSLPVSGSKSSKSRRESSTAAAAAIPEQTGSNDRDRFRLIVLTTSGAWYKVALEDDASRRGEGERSKDGERVQDSTVLDMYREDAAHGGKKGEKSGLACKLEEYRRFGDSADGWEF